jgi:hypothetical protein
MNCDPSGNITASLNEQMAVMGMVAILACTLEMTYHPIYNMFSLLITTIYESAVVTKDFIDDWADGISKGLKKAKDLVKEIADEATKAIPKDIAIPDVKCPPLQKKPVVFPVNPYDFKPYGMKSYVYETENGIVIKWGYTKKITIFEWNEDLNNVSHYHCLMPEWKNKHIDGLHYLPGWQIPEPWATYYRGW